MAERYSLKRLNLLYALVQVMYFAAFAAFCGFQTALLLDRGFTGSQAGLLAAVRFLAGIIAQPTIGGWLDRHPQVPLKRVVTLMLGAGLAVNLLFYFTRLPLLGTALITLLLGILELNLYPLLDSLALQFINAGVDINYSFSRGLGSLAYAVACAVLGVLSAAWGTEVTLLAHMLALAGVILAVNLFPAPPEGAATEREEASHSVLEILKGNRSFTLMLLAVFFAIAAVMPVVGFLVSIVEERGGSETHLGWALFLMGAAELPAALLFPKLRERLGSGVMMLISVIFMAAKPLLFLVSPTLGTLLLAQLIQLPGYGFFTPAAVYYANESVSAADRVRGQAIMMTASNGLGGMAGNLLAGLVVDWGGVDGLLMACTALGALGILFALASVRSQKEV